MEEANKVYVIAEAGVNHNGDLEVAKQLVSVARRSGADCVKFQTFKADRVAISTAPKAHYQLLVTDRGESQHAMLKQLELSLEAHRELIDFCRESSIDFMSTPYSIEDIDMLEHLGVKAYKIASGQIVEPLLLKAAAATGKPLFLSTGMATLAEVDEAVRGVRQAGNDQIVLLQCTTNYPSLACDANLRSIATMRAAFETTMGYSDHTQSDTACLVAIGLGARVIEKHLTLDKALPGPDHSSSADPGEFARLVSAVREAELALGAGEKSPCAVEIENARGMRRSLVAARHIRAGEVFVEEMFTCKRPGTGVRPSLLPEVLGCRAVRDIELDEMITWAMCGEKVCTTYG